MVMKNSKIKVGLVALLMSTGLLVGCNSGPNIGPEEKPHEHALVSVDAKAATYYKEGNIKYYYCPDCNKKFSDSTGTTEISDADVILKKKTILEETTEPGTEEYIEPVLLQADVTNGTSKFVSLEGGEVSTGLYVSHDKTGDDYTTISLSLSSPTDGIVAFEFDYRYLDNSNDRQYDMKGHNYISIKVDGETEPSFVPHTNGKLNKDCAWHTFSYHEADNLADGISAFEIKIYHFDGELVINNVYVIHEVAGSTSTNPSTVDHYEDLEGGAYWYDYDNDEYISVAKEDIQIVKQSGLKPTCDNAGYKEYYFCGYTREYYEDKDGETVIEDIDAWKAEGGAGYLAPAHELEPVSGQPATCTAPGYKDCYKCKACGKYFEDDKGETPIDDYDTWKTDAGKIEALGHSFDENGNCTRTGCNETIGNYLGLDTASNLDETPAISLSGLGVTASQWLDISEGHVWSQKNLITNKGLDLTFDIKHTSDFAGTLLQVFAGSNKNGDNGLCFRIDHKADGSYYGFIYGGGGEGVIDVPTAGEDNGTKYKFADGVFTPSETATVRICMEYDSTSTSKYNYSIYINGNRAINTDGSTMDRTATYAYSLSDNNWIRFSQTANCKIKESSVEYTKELVVLTESGCVGKKVNLDSTIVLPSLNKENHDFLGWFNQDGNMVANSSSITKRTIVKPVFIEHHANLFAPSDVGFDSKGKEYSMQPSENVKGDYELSDKKNPDVTVGFILDLKLKPNGDHNVNFGIAYDQIDAKTRCNVRFNWGTSYDGHNGILTGFMYGASLGSAGDSTKFDSANFEFKLGYKYYVGLSLKQDTDAYTADSPFTFSFEIINLNDGSRYSLTKSVTFTVDYDMVTANVNRNKLNLTSTTADAASVTDAW